MQSLTADLGTLAHAAAAFNIRVPGDTAHYLLTASATGSLQAVVTPGSDFQGRLQLQFLDPDTLAVLSTGENSANGVRASVQVTKGQSLLVSVSGDATARGDFTLSLTNLDEFNTAGNKMLFVPAGEGPSSVAVADLNRDGIVDLVVPDALSNVVSILLGNGDGTFQSPRQFAVGAFTTLLSGIANGTPTIGRSVAVADLNDDGIPDVIVTNAASSDVSVLLGRGDGTFQPQRRSMHHPVRLRWPWAI